MRFSRGYFYKCLLADQTAPCPHGGVKLMLGTGGRWNGRGKRLFSSYFLLLFHPSEVQEAHPQTIWYLQICCESWGSARAQQYPLGLLGGPSPRLLSPSCRGSFLHGFPYRTSASASPSWPATPVLHYGAEHNTRTETGKLYFIRQPRSAPETPLELIHSAAFDSLLLRGCVEVLGALQEDHLKDFLSRFECTKLRLN